ncbi:MAG: DEAD/DEAH box helicase family protein [Candidatus Bathyarchaeota archaeon]|nr:DEAD/DEAH box helicase family protein [Candidatus Bathyarchaeota archaeon]
MFARLSYLKGTVLIEGDLATPYGQWDPRVRAYRAPACYYSDILRYLRNSRIRFEDNVLKPPPAPSINGVVTLYPYQEEAFKRWVENGCRGVICIATAGGKTFIGLKAVETLKQSTLVLVPTLALVDQWAQRFREVLGVETGTYGGGKRDLSWVTISTYDSAYIHAEELGDKFVLLIADEVHHIFAPGYSQATEMFAAPYRLGLTSTLHRADMRHLDAPRLIGSVVYEASHEELAGTYIAPYEHQKVFVELTPQEKAEYERYWSVYTDYLAQRGLEMKSEMDFQKLIKLSAFDPKAREALLARNKALKVALNSEVKMRFLAEQLKNSSEKTLIFTQFNSLVYAISKRFLVPAITHKTSEAERRLILSRFRSGEYTTIVTSQVLDEGLDVPDASRGIVLSGSGSQRQHIQRLGRLLRKSSSGKVATLIEVVSKETKEMAISRRRKRKNSEDA